LKRIRRRDGEALANLHATDLPDGAAAGIHPALLDAALQTIAAALPADVRESRDASALLPVTIERYRVHGDCPEPHWGHAVIRPSPASFPARIVADVRLLDALGHLVAEVHGVGFEGVELSRPLPPSTRDTGAAAGAGRGTSPNASPPTRTDTMPGDDRSPRAILRSVSPAERPLLLERYLTRELADALGAEIGQLSADEPLHTLGLDSFMIVRLATRLERELGVEVPLGRLMQGPSVAELTAELLRQLDEVP
jgi:acyl carrier protein